VTRWVTVADLERCVGCQTCTVACRHANATSPAVQWRKVLDVEAGSYPNVSRTFVPVGCQHCADPPCMHVCPTTATRQRADGIVTIDYELCIGCAYCEVACPYQARFLEHTPHFAYGGAGMANEIERAEPSRMGVAQKCTYCSDRIDFGIENGVAPGMDPRATPACVNSCIADALHFGDIENPDSNVSRLLREQRSFRMHEEIGTEPNFYYVYGRADAMPAPASEPVSPSSRGAGELRTRGVEPSLQQHWDWKAASNFICGGAGIGLFTFATLASFWQSPLAALGWIAMALVATGLGLLLFKIGRPWRSLYVMLQPRRSWMTREAWIAAVFFPLGALALWFASPALMLAAAVLGLSFLFCQAMILQAAKGIPAWRIPAVVPLIMVTGIAEGSGLFLAAAALTRAPVAETVAVAAVILAGMRFWTWRFYLAALATEGAPTRMFAVFDAFKPWFFLIGLAVPAALIALGFFTPGAMTIAFTVAGLGIAFAGSALKLILVTRASFNQGFALKHTPVRGAGITGPAVKPGWSTVKA
jgi:phenylacetyl-CoA:acceptor oxidoreductase subunit 1